MIKESREIFSKWEEDQQTEGGRRGRGWGLEDLRSVTCVYQLPTMSVVSTCYKHEQKNKNGSNKNGERGSTDRGREGGGERKGSKQNQDALSTRVHFLRSL